MVALKTKCPNCGADMIVYGELLVTVQLIQPVQPVETKPEPKNELAR